MVSLSAIEICCTSLDGECFLSLSVVALCRVVHDLWCDWLLKCLIQSGLISLRCLALASAQKILFNLAAAVSLDF